MDDLQTSKVMVLIEFQHLINSVSLPQFLQNVCHQSFYKAKLISNEISVIQQGNVFWKAGSVNN